MVQTSLRPLPGKRKSCMSFLLSAGCAKLICRYLSYSVGDLRFSLSAFVGSIMIGYLLEFWVSRVMEFDIMEEFSCKF